MKDMAVDGYGKKVLLIKDNKIVGKGSSQGSIDYTIGIRAEEGEMLEQLKASSAAKILEVKWILPRFSQVTGGYVGSGFPDGEDIDAIFGDVSVVDEFNFSFGFCPDHFKDVPGYRSKFDDPPTILKDKPHPEKQEDEVFICNASTYSMWEVIPWKTKRQGVQALDDYGQPISRKGTTPIFAKRQEVESQGMVIKSVQYLPQPTAEEREQLARIMKKEK